MVIPFFGSLAKVGSPAKVGGAIKKLGKNSFESVYKERYIADTTELISERLDFCIKTLTEARV